MGGVRGRRTELLKGGNGIKPSSSFRFAGGLQLSGLIPFTESAGNYPENSCRFTNFYQIVLHKRRKH